MSGSFVPAEPGSAASSAQAGAGFLNATRHPARGPTNGPQTRAEASVRGENLWILGVEYLRWHTTAGELYLTRFGCPFAEQLAPENWYAPDWFVAQRTRLPGTSAIYRVPTRTIGGVSLDLVVRFSRVGEEVPLDTLTVCQYPHAEFNSPFEEIALVMQLRAVCAEASRPVLLTKRPLAVFAPAQRLQRWQTGRRENKLAAKRARHPEVELDLLQPYLLLYGWIDGLNAVQTADQLGLPEGPRQAFLADLTQGAIRDLAAHGFRMLDIKPEHLLLRLRPDGTLLQRPDGQPAYALVDYELLERLEARALPTDGGGRQPTSVGSALPQPSRSASSPANAA